MIVPGCRSINSVCSVTFLSKTHLCRDTSITLIILKALTLFYKDNCNSAPNLNIFIIFSALETLEYDPFFKKMIH